MMWLGICFALPAMVKHLQTFECTIYCGKVKYLQASAKITVYDVFVGEREASAEATPSVAAKSIFFLRIRNQFLLERLVPHQNARRAAKSERRV